MQFTHGLFIQNSATLIFHMHENTGVGGLCHDSISTETFSIHSLNPNGSGTAGLTCNNAVGCGWELNIQVDRHRSMFNLVDVDPQNPDNFVAGTAIRQQMSDFRLISLQM